MEQQNTESTMKAVKLKYTDKKDITFKLEYNELLNTIS